MTMKSCRPSSFVSRRAFLDARLSVLLCGVLLNLAFAAAARADGPLRVGFGHEDITPEIGDRPVWMAGFGQNRRATGVHDAIGARAVVLEADGKRIALVALDLIGFFHESVERVRTKLSGFDYVLVASTHGHEGPDTMGLWGPAFGKTGVDPEYLASVEAKAAAAARQAAEKLERVDAAFGAATDESLVADHREPYVKDGEIRVLVFRRPGAKATDKPAGILVQWNCHPETLGSKNTLASSDFPGATRAYLEKQFGCPVAFFNGAIGGMMTSLGLDVHDADGNKLEDGTFEKSDRYGQLIGQFAERTLAHAQPIRLGPFAIRSRKLFIPQDNTGYRAMMAFGVTDRKVFGWTESPDKADPVDGKSFQGRMAIQTEVGVLRLGELTIAAVPGELYPELAVGKIQDPQDPAADFQGAPKEPCILPLIGSPKRMIFGLANDEIGYIIPKSQWDVAPPFCYGRTKAQYGETNSVGPETAPILCEAIRQLLKP